MGVLEEDVGVVEDGVVDDEGVAEDEVGMPVDETPGESCRRRIRKVILSTHPPVIPLHTLLGGTTSGKRAAQMRLHSTYSRAS